MNYESVGEREKGCKQSIVPEEQSASRRIIRNVQLYAPQLKGWTGLTQNL